jgi:hypothetical protein
MQTVPFLEAPDPAGTVTVSAIGHTVLRFAFERGGVLFDRLGEDLVLLLAGGGRMVLADFFAAENTVLPLLQFADGAPVDVAAFLPALGRASSLPLTAHHIGANPEGMAAAAAGAVFRVPGPWREQGELAGAGLPLPVETQKPAPPPPGGKPDAGRADPDQLEALIRSGYRMHVEDNEMVFSRLGGEDTLDRAVPESGAEGTRRPPARPGSGSVRPDASPEGGSPALGGLADILRPDMAVGDGAEFAPGSAQALLGRDGRFAGDALLDPGDLKALAERKQGGGKDKQEDALVITVPTGV